MTTRQLFLAIWGMSLFAMGVRETLDPDMWWHLRTGELILTQGIPRHDVFSFTVSHHAWITHEWLSQLLMWTVYAAAGFPGLIISFALIVLAISGLLYLASDKRPFLPAFLTLWAAIASAIVWGARPQMFNLLFGASFIFILEWVRRGKSHPRWLWALVPLTAVWANLHSGYLFGVVLATTFLAGEAGQRWWQPQRTDLLTWSQLKQLAIVVVLSFLAAVANPSGIALWWYPFETLGSHAMQTYIQEWHAPILAGIEFLPFFLLVAAGIVSFAIGLWRKRFSPFWSDMLLFGGTAVASFTSRRHIPLFAIVAVPILVRWLAPYWPTIETIEAPTKGWLRLNTLLCLLIGFLVIGWTTSKIANNNGAIAQQYPVAAVTFLEEHGFARERGYNNYNWGGYLIWRGHPVFVDGRADVYGDQFLLYYRETFEGRATWERPLIDCDVRYVLIEPNTRLGHLLNQSPNWQLAYEDAVALVYIHE
ncbi:MAG: hypothetical protein AAF614_36925 [Chloroflexota bacterium]